MLTGTNIAYPSSCISNSHIFYYIDLLLLGTKNSCGLICPVPEQYSTVILSICIKKISGKVLWGANFKDKNQYRRIIIYVACAK